MEISMAGLFVVPLKKDFKKGTLADQKKVWEEVNITKEEKNALVRKMKEEV